jgi:hypothetical protein
MAFLTGPQMVERTRRYIDDLVEPYSIPDFDIYSFLSEAQRELALVGKLLRSVDTYRILAGSRWLTLTDAPEIIEVRTATLIDSANNRYQLDIRGTMDSGAYSAYLKNDYGQLIAAQDKLTAGRPRVLFFGKSANTVQVLEVSPVPDAAYSIELTTVNYPSEDISNSTSEIEIPERYANAVPIGAALRACELDPFFDDNSKKLQSLGAAWQQALLRAVGSNASLSRDAGVVQFSNSYW